MYLTVSVFPSSMTSGPLPPASAASSFVRWSPHDWYSTLTSTPGCCCLKALVALATTSGQLSRASGISQTVIEDDADAEVGAAVRAVPVVAATSASATAPTAATMRTLIRISSEAGGLSQLVLSTWPRRESFILGPACQARLSRAFPTEVVLTADVYG